MLSVVSLDGNNGLFPLAFMVAKSENKDSQLYFLDYLREAIGPSKEDKPFTFMSDK